MPAGKVWDSLMASFARRGAWLAPVPRSAALLPAPPARAVRDLPARERKTAKAAERNKMDTPPFPRTRRWDRGDFSSAGLPPGARAEAQPLETILARAESRPAAAHRASAVHRAPGPPPAG